MPSRQEAIQRLSELQAHFEQAMQIPSPQERSRACEEIIKEADAICEAFAELKNTRSSWFGPPPRPPA